MTLDNLFFVDALDAWQTFGIAIESGTDDFLRLPPAKDKLSHNWLDEDGIDIDLTKTYLKSREIQIKFFGIHPDKATFFTRYEQFVALLRQPGSRRLSVTRHNKDYRVYYSDNNNYASFNFFNGSSGNVLAKFSLNFIEASPNLSSSGDGTGGNGGGNGGDGSGLPPFIVDQAGKFLIA